MSPRFKSFLPSAAVTVLLAGSILLISGQVQTPDAHGQELFEKRCGGCHALDRDKEGPRLGGVYGRAAASITSFDYSAGLEKSQITWKEGTLDKWLTDPEKLVPDNDMAFRVENAQERRDIISYLEQTSGN
jgi:cytochrome c